MNKVNRITKNYINKPGIISLGNFDGIHLGHQRILKKNYSDSQKMNINSYVLTFSCHPNEVLRKINIQHLTTADEKYELFDKIGISTWFNVPFDISFSKMSPEEFIIFLLKNINIKKIIVGFNYFFGVKKSGNTDVLKKLGKKYGFDVEIINSVNYNEHVISSTIIRETIKLGKVEKASFMLGRYYNITGKVINGNKIGRKIGFPTANISVKNKCIPHSGVYFVSVIIDKRIYKGIANIGYKPTISLNNNISIEIHILNFNEELYNKNISVFFIKRLRDEKKFDNIEQLKLKIDEDINSIKTMDVIK